MERTMPAVSTVQRPPKLGIHRTTGKYRIQIPAHAGGGSRFFGSDFPTAQALYKQWTEEAWPCLIGSTVTASPTRTNGLGMAKKTHIVPTLQGVADSLFQLVDAESGKAGQKNIRFRLRLFLDQYGSRAADSLTPAELIAFKGKLTGQYSPEFSNNCLSALRRLLTFAFETAAVETPYRLGVLKAVPRGALKVKGLKPENATALLKEIAQRNRPLATLCLIQLYGVLRPSEAPKVAYSLGEEKPYGLDIESKTTRKSGELRACLITPECAALIADFRAAVGERRRLYSTHNAYRLACWVVGTSIGPKRLMELTGKKTLAPHNLRHTANQLLLDSGVSEDAVRAGMGRVRPREDRTYGTANYEAARQSIRVLAKIIPPSVLDSGKRLSVKSQTKGKMSKVA
jgi:integrase